MCIYAYLAIQSRRLECRDWHFKSSNFHFLFLSQSTCLSCFTDELWSPQQWLWSRWISTGLRDCLLKHFFSCCFLNRLSDLICCVSYFIHTDDWKHGDIRRRRGPRWRYDRDWQEVWADVAAGERGRLWDAGWGGYRRRPASPRRRWRWEEGVWVTHRRRRRFHATIRRMAGCLGYVDRP